MHKTMIAPVCLGILLVGIVMVPSAFAANIITNQNFLSITEDPDAYKGVWAKLSGTIANTQDFGDYDAYIFTLGGVDSTRNSMSVYNEKGGITFDRGDCVVIEGTIDGSTTLSSAFGGELDVPYMWIGKQTKVEIDCLQAMYPAIATAEPNDNRSVGSAKITLEKVVLTADHTRAFFTVENNYSSADLLIYSHNGLIVQDRKQYESAYIYGEDYDDFQSSVPAGIIETGWFIFDPIEQKPFEIRIEVGVRYENWSSNWDEDLTFNINNLDIVPTSTPEKATAPTPTPTPTPTPAQQASGGCGTGTVLVDGVCQLAPQESNDGCGAGTVMVNGVCQLDNSSGSRIPPIYIVGAAAAIGAAIIGIVSAVRRGSKTSKPQQSEPSQPQTQSVSSTVKNVVNILADDDYITSEKKARQQELEEYEEKYLARQGQRPTRKPAETRQTSSSCNSCGRPLKPTAKFCGECGTPRS